MLVEALRIASKPSDAVTVDDGLGWCTAYLEYEHGGCRLRGGFVTCASGEDSLLVCVLEMFSTPIARSRPELAGLDVATVEAEAVRS